MLSNPPICHRCPLHTGISNQWEASRRYCSICGRELLPGIPPPGKDCSCDYHLGNLDRYCSHCGRPALSRMLRKEAAGQQVLITVH